MNKNLNILPGSIKDFEALRLRVRNNYNPYEDVYGFDDYLFKAIRDRYVDTSINELGSIFFSFEYVDIINNKEDAEGLRNLYLNFGWAQPGSQAQSMIGPFLKEVGAESIKKNLTIRAHDLSTRKFTAGDDSELGTDAYLMRMFPYKFVDEENFLDFEFSEFAYFVLNTQRPANFYTHPKKPYEEAFSLKGFLVVRNILGYNESEPLIREIESRRPLFFTPTERFESPFGGNFCLKALRTPEEVKNYWDSLVEPSSILNIEQSYSLDHIRFLHGSLFFRPNIAGFYSFPSMAARLLYEERGKPSSSIDFYSNKYIKLLHEQYSHRLDGGDPRDSSFDTDAFDNKPIYDSRTLLKSSILGVPVKCSYTTPAVLYNLFNIFVKVNNISFKEGIYYQTIGNSFIKPLGNESWFKEHYFEIVDNLFFHFDFFVRGVDYFKLFSLQIDNVLTIMKMIPLDGTSGWRIKESGTAAFSNNYSFLKTANKITYLSN